MLKFICVLKNKCFGLTTESVMVMLLTYNFLDVCHCLMKTIYELIVKGILTQVIRKHEMYMYYQ